MESSYKATSSWLMNSRGQKLHVVHFESNRSPLLARLFFHHGLAEHVMRYGPVFSQMSSAGIEVHSFDAHGHGRSEPLERANRALVWSFKHLLDDFELVVDSAPDAHGIPTFIGGHSMGGLVAAHAALSLSAKGKQLAGMLLHSPALDVEWTAILRVQTTIGGVISALFPRARIVPALRPEDMSQDPKVVEDYLEDPLNTFGNLCARTGYEILSAFKILGALSHKLSLPIYVGHGSLDKCTSFSASQRFAKSVQSKDVTFREYTGGYHELLHGPESVEATERMVSWILQHCTPTKIKL